MSFVASKKIAYSTDIAETLINLLLKLKVDKPIN